MTRLVRFGSLLLFCAGVLHGCAKPGAAEDTTAVKQSTGPQPRSGMAGPGLDPGDHEFQLTHDGRARRYLVHVPPAGAPTALPVVVALHGGGGNAEGTRRAYGYEPVSDREGFVVVYPEGVGEKKLGRRYAKWNVGACCAEPDGADDVAFIVAVLDDVSTRLSVDPNRVYAAGLSNGSVMARELACKASDRFAAVVGTGALEGEACRAPRPVPTLYVAGEKDPCVPFEGGSCGGCFQRAMRDMGIPVLRIPQFTCPRVEEGIASLARAHGCRDVPRETYRNQNATCVAYTDCRDDAEVRYCVDADLGHEWPGGPEVPACRRRPNGKLCRAYRDNVGPRSDAIDLATMSWAFFERFTMSR